MDVSIIIPTFRSTNKLIRLLDSIGFYSKVEVIVINDDPSDDITPLSNKYPNVFVFNNSRSKGAGGARNTGIKYARGKYVLFADSDDIFCANWFNLVLSYVRQDLFDVIYFAPSSFLASDAKVSGRRAKRYQTLVENWIVDGNEDIRYYFYVPWSKLIRLKLLVDNNILFEEIVASNDLNFSLRVGLLAGMIFADKNTIYSVEQSSSSMTTTDTVLSICCRLNALFRFNQTLMEHNLSPKKLMMGGRLFQLMMRSPWLACKYLLKGLVLRNPIFFDHRFKR